MAKTKVEFIVCFPEAFTDRYNQHQVADYIRDAVRFWSKGGDPDSPFWDASSKATVTIRSYQVPITE